MAKHDLKPNWDRSPHQAVFLSPDHAPRFAVIAGKPWYFVLDGVNYSRYRFHKDRVVYRKNGAKLACCRFV